MTTAITIRTAAEITAIHANVGYRDAAVRQPRIDQQIHHHHLPWAFSINLDGRLLTKITNAQNPRNQWDAGGAYDESPVPISSLRRPEALSPDPSHCIGTISAHAGWSMDESSTYSPGWLEVNGDAN
tara:strand:+ start:1498 stop:1878 length:381 start_codon:yes stop_codon:yes gene_type:complete